jgi:hypothetical protein
MNSTFPATPYTATIIASISDAATRRYLEYDSWLYYERVHNWAEYISYVQYKKQQENDLRIRMLRQQYEISMGQFYEHQRQMLQAQKAEKEQQDKDNADLESYLKEIDEQHQLQALEAEQVILEQVTDEEWNETAEKFSNHTSTRRERQCQSRRERRSIARQNKAIGKILLNANEPVDEELARSENYNADKPSHTVRYVGADKRKGQRFQARRQFGSGWAKQLE